MGSYRLVDVNFSYNGIPVIEGLEMEIKAGSFLGLLGPNGSGKTTLLKLLSGILVPQKGTVYLNGREVSKIPAQERAKLLGVVPQESHFDFPFSLQEVVAMGRYPYLDWWGRLSSKDRQKIDEALHLTGLFAIKDNMITNLSGGEKQRGIIARALAQEPLILLLDEPVSNLDIRYQQEIFELLNALNREKGITIIIISHDLNLAAQYCTSLALLGKGLLKAYGAPQKVLNEKLIEEVYGVKVELAINEKTKRPQVFLLPKIKPISSPREEKELLIHIVGGGGSARHILFELYQQGYPMTLGVINDGDTDSEIARYLDIACVVEAPFSPISGINSQANELLMAQADLILIADVPFGLGNLINLEQVVTACRAGKRVLAIEGGKIEKRDFTGGEAKRLWGELKSLGMKEFPLSEIIQYLKEGDKDGKKKN